MSNKRIDPLHTVKCHRNLTSVSWNKWVIRDLSSLSEAFSSSADWAQTTQKRNAVKCFRTLPPSFSLAWGSFSPQNIPFFPSLLQFSVPSAHLCLSLFYPFIGLITFHFVSFLLFLLLFCLLALSFVWCFSSVCWFAGSSFQNVSQF